MVGLGDFSKRRTAMPYEFVSKKEYKPYYADVCKLLDKLHHFMREHYDITFQHELIGSGKHHLITRRIGGNQGFDFDFNLVLQKWGDYRASDLNNLFMNGLNEAVKGTRFKFPEDSTSVYTIKIVNQKKSKVCFSCDFAIVYYSDRLPEGYYCLKNHKIGDYIGNHSFEPRSFSTRYLDKLDKILMDPDGWNSIRDEYLKLKNCNHDPNKPSFALYQEAICNVYNQISGIISEVGFSFMNKSRF